jgi:hypothetical protein
MQSGCRGGSTPHAGFLTTALPRRLGSRPPCAGRRVRGDPSRRAAPVVPSATAPAQRSRAAAHAGVPERSAIGAALVKPAAVPVPRPSRRPLRARRLQVRDHRPVAAAVLRAGVLVAVEVVVPEVPVLVRVDQLIAARTANVAAGYFDRPPLAQLLMAVAVAAVGRLRHRQLIGERNAECAVNADAEVPESTPPPLGESRGRRLEATADHWLPSTPRGGRGAHRLAE